MDNTVDSMFVRDRPLDFCRLERVWKDVIRVHSEAKDPSAQAYSRSSDGSFEYSTESVGRTDLFK